MIGRVNMLLATLLAVVVALTFWVRVDYSRPNVEVLPDMKYSPASKAYTANPQFPNGRTLQAPVLGTIARRTSPLHYAATKEDALRAGEELRNPHVRESQDAAATNAEHWLASVQRGAEVYTVFCVACHGATGAGDGPVSQRGFPPPPSLLTGKSRDMRDGQLFHILTYGQNTMPSFAPQLAHARRWDVINHIRELQSKVAASPEVK